MNGEKLFLDILFLKNKSLHSKMPRIVLKDIETYNSIKTKNEESVNQYEFELINFIKTRSPDYFGNFKNTIESGDHFKIKKVLIEGGTLYENYIQSLGRESLTNENGLVINFAGIVTDPVIFICFILPFPSPYLNEGFTLDYYVDLIVSNY
jgi:SdpC family antimicrobial peptide